MSLNINNLVSGCCFPLERLANGTKFSTFRSKGKKLLFQLTFNQKLSFLAW